MVEAYFSAKGAGVPLAELNALATRLGSMVELDLSMLLEQPEQEFDEVTPAYRTLAKGDASIGYVTDAESLLFVTVRNGRKLACVNLTSPNRVERFCTLREVKDAFAEAEELDSGSVGFKVSYVNTIFQE
jgi:hypothetical protein